MTSGGPVKPAAFGSDPNGDMSPTTPVRSGNGVVVDSFDAPDSGVAPLAFACVVDTGVNALRRGPPCKPPSRARDPERTGHDSSLKKLAIEGDSGDCEPDGGGGDDDIREAARRDPLACPERALERSRREFFGVKDPAPRLNSTFSPDEVFEDMSKPSAGPDGTQVRSPRSLSPSSEEE